MSVIQHLKCIAYNSIITTTNRMGGIIHPRPREAVYDHDTDHVARALVDRQVDSAVRIQAADNKIDVHSYLPNFICCSLVAHQIRQQFSTPHQKLLRAAP